MAKTETVLALDTSEIAAFLKELDAALSAATPATRHLVADIIASHIRAGDGIEWEYRADDAGTTTVAHPSPSLKFAAGGLIGLYGTPCRA